jgi:hypothetical protein
LITIARDLPCFPAQNECDGPAQFTARAARKNPENFPKSQNIAA